MEKKPQFIAKEKEVAELQKLFEESEAVVVADYRGITVDKDVELRAALRKADVEYRVAKNTLIRIASHNANLGLLDAELNGPTAIAFGADETSAAKAMVAAAKDYDSKVILKSAFVDNAYVDKAGVKALASMPSREELVAKMLGSMQAPLANFAGVLSNLMGGIVRVLNGIAQSKEA